jgi:hypothetical protein
VLNFLKDNQSSIGNLVTSKALTVIEHLEKSTDSGGFAKTYYAWRCTEDKGRDFINAFDQEYYKIIMDCTPGKISKTDLHDYSYEMKKLLSKGIGFHMNDDTKAVIHKQHEAVINQLDDLLGVINEGIILERSKGVFRWSKYHKEILVWTFPYIFYQLVPYFKGLFKWVMGEKIGWQKTSRTPKHKPGNIGK